jgi:hypothetical protein
VRRETVRQRMRRRPLVQPRLHRPLDVVLQQVRPPSPSLPWPPPPSSSGPLSVPRPVCLLPQHPFPPVFPSPLRGHSRRRVPMEP